MNNEKERGGEAHLRGDARVVAARIPEHLMSEHSVPVSTETGTRLEDRREEKRREGRKGERREEIKMRKGKRKKEKRTTARSSPRLRW